MRKKNLITAVVFLLCFVGIATGHCENADKVITNVSNWNHPVRAVLEKNKVTLKKVELYKAGKFPVFFVDFQYDPQSSANTDYFHKLYLEVLEANGYWDYAFDDDLDSLIVSIHWDRTSKKMSVEYEDKPK